jgi:dihydrofolate reductase
MGKEAEVQLLGRADPEWQNTTVISGYAAEEMATLKRETNGVILVAGSGTLVGTLLAADLGSEAACAISLRRWTDGATAAPDPAAWGSRRRR